MLRGFFDGVWDEQVFEDWGRCIVVGAGDGVLGCLDWVIDYWLKEIAIWWDGDRIQITSNSAAIQNNSVTCRVSPGPLGDGCGVLCRFKGRLDYKPSTTKSTIAELAALQDNRLYLVHNPLTHPTSQHPQPSKSNL